MQLVDCRKLSLEVGSNVELYHDFLSFNILELTSWLSLIIFIFFIITMFMIPNVIKCIIQWISLEFRSKILLSLAGRSKNLQFVFPANHSAPASF